MDVPAASGWSPSRHLLRGVVSVIGRSFDPVVGRIRRDGGSAEGEAVGLGTGAEELDLERSLPDGARLADQLVQALVDEGALARRVHVEPVGVPGRSAV